jgi:hypothetical protein
MTPARIEKLIDKVFAVVGGAAHAHALLPGPATRLIIERIPLDAAAVAIERISDPNRKLAVASALCFALWDTSDLQGVFTAAQIKALRAAAKDFFPYPGQSLQMRALLFLGESPKMLSGGYLTNAEAHAWLSDDQFVFRSRAAFGVWGIAARSWFIRKYAGVEAGAVAGPTDRVVWAWLRRMLQSPRQRLALTESREPRRAVTFRRNPAGRITPVRFAGGAFIARLDELEEEDLTDAVSTTFENANTRRLLERDGFDPDESLATPPSWWVEDPRVQLLLTTRELVDEGENMRHCVGGYSKKVKAGDALVFVISLPSLYDSTICRSTVEVEPTTGEVLQHRGYKNADPDPACVEFLQELTKRWGERVRHPEVDPRLWPYRRLP